ncbi:MAG: GAF domain-containing protein [Fimbriimonas sp.]|nr:GAF domain-containing protein [Fimbriimonas sp.]
MSLSQDYSGYWEADATTFCFTSDTYESIRRLFYSQGLRPISWEELLGAEPFARFRSLVEDARREARGFSFETQLVVAGDSTRCIRIVGDSPSPLVLRGFVTDCTSSRSEESRVLARHRELFEGIPSPVICYDWFTRRILDVNNEAIKVYGYDKAEFLSMMVEHVFPPEQREVLLEQFLHIDPAKPLRAEWMHMRKDGTRMDVDVASHAIEFRGLDARLAIVRDITDRRRFEEDLELSNERLVLMTGVAGTVIGSLPLVDQAKLMTDQVCHAFKADACVIRLLRGEHLVLLASTGIDPAAMPERISSSYGLGHTVMKSRAPLTISDVREIPDDAPMMTGYNFISYAGAPMMVKERMIGVIAIYTDREARQFQLGDLDHLQIVANNIAVAVLNDELYDQLHEQKTVLEQEIKERVRIEDALLRYSESLRESEERLRLVTEASTDGIWVWDRDTDTLTWSDRVYDLLGLDPSIMSARLRDGLSIVHPDDRRPFLPAVVRQAHKGSAFRMEIRLRRGDHSFGRYQLYCTLARDKDDRPVRMVGSLHDITEKVQREREMEAVAAISLALREVESTEEMLPIVSEQIARILDLPSVGLALVDHDSREVVIRHVSGVFNKLLGTRLAKQQGFVGQVFGEAEARFVANIRDEPESIIGQKLESPTAVLGVPLVARGEVIGVLWLGKTSGLGQKDAEFSTGEGRLLSILAEIAAASLRRVALRERTEFHLKRLHSLSIIHATVSENLNLRTTLDMLLEQLKSQTGIDAAAIHLYDEASTSFKLETLTGFGSGVTVPSLGRDLIVNRYRSRLSELQETGTRGRRFGAMIAAGFESYLAVPLIANENIVGVLEIYHKTELPQGVDLDNFAEMLASQAAIAVDNATLLRSLRNANRELIAAYDATIEGWSRALDLRDHETEGHSRRVTDMTVELSKLVGVPPSQIADIRRGALLHDIGKMAIPDSVLHKPGDLDQSELIVMRRHPGIALDLLAPVSFLKTATDIPFCHHERWDGSGYPRGLKGEDIPLAARIFAVIDVWDALCSDRPYRKRWSTEQAVHYIRIQSGRQFDPDIVEIFLNNLSLFAIERRQS